MRNYPKTGYRTASFFKSKITLTDAKVQLGKLYIVMPSHLTFCVFVKCHSYHASSRLQPQNKNFVPNITKKSLPRLFEAFKLVDIIVT